MSSTLPTVNLVNVVESLTTSPGAKVGLFGVAPAARGAAYTQTYSTAARTVPAATFVAPVSTAATSTTPFGYATAAQADAIRVGTVANAADILALKQVVNAIIDDLQALGVVA